MEIISIRDMLEDMEQGQPFSMEIVKYDRNAGTGGQIKVIPEAFLRRKNTTLKPSEVLDPHERNPVNKKSPNHYLNYTRNIRLLKDGGPTNDMISIHPPLVLIYNGKKVVP